MRGATFIHIILALSLFLLVLFGGLYWAAKSLNFRVPQQFVLPELLLQEAVYYNIQYEGKHIDAIDEIAGVMFEGNYNGSMLRVKIEKHFAEVAIVYWNNESDRELFWRKYYRQLCSGRIRRNTFRNNLWEPNFITGRFGWRVGEDISAWSQGHWFFLVAVSTEIANHSAIKVSLRSLLLDYVERKYS